MNVVDDFVVAIVVAIVAVIVGLALAVPVVNSFREETHTSNDSLAKQK